jgi:ABC-type oligopeptide transport system substrate-binding subunit
MKQTILILILTLSLSLAGCSGQSLTTQTETTPEELSEVDPGLKEKGYVRSQLTDPALYDYLNKESGGISNPGTVVPAKNADKIGKTSTFGKNRKLEISGTAQIISENKIRVSSFSYNGGCGSIYFGLAIANSSDKPFAKLKEIATAQSNVSFEMVIPSNISLNQFEVLGVYCNSEKSPVSSANF